MTFKYILNIVSSSSSSNSGNNNSFQDYSNTKNSYKHFSAVFQTHCSRVDIVEPEYEKASN